MSDLWTMLAVVLVAAANCANDNAKGVATLVGCGAASRPRAIAWGTLATLAGSLAAIGFSTRMVQTFSGAGLVSDALVGAPSAVPPASSKNSTTRINDVVVAGIVAGAGRPTSPPPCVLRCNKITTMAHGF